MDKDFAASVINVDFSVDWVHTGLKHVHREYGSDVTKIRRTITKTGLPKQEYECNRLTNANFSRENVEIENNKFHEIWIQRHFQLLDMVRFRIYTREKKITKNVSVLWENDRVHSLRQSADDHRIIVAKLNSMRQEKEGRKKLHTIQNELNLKTHSDVEQTAACDLTIIHCRSLTLYALFSVNFEFVHV